MKILFKCLILLTAINVANSVSAKTYFTKIEDDLYLVAEKISPNDTKWFAYQRAASSTNNLIGAIAGVMLKNLQTDGTINPSMSDAFKDLKEFQKFIAGKSRLDLEKTVNIFRDQQDGLSNFENGLRNTLANHQGSMSDVWVTYATTKLPNSPDFDNNKIEMAMTVLAKANSPIVMHMGISRNVLNQLNEHNQHPRISARLHAFAARVILREYEHARYMVTTPLSSMAGLLKGALPPHSFAEGMNQAGTWIEQTMHDGDSGFALLPNDPEYRFSLYDRDIASSERKLIITIDKTNVREYLWLRFHTSLKEHPYFAVKLHELAKLLVPDIELLN